MGFGSSRADPSRRGGEMVCPNRRTAVRTRARPLWARKQTPLSDVAGGLLKSGPPMRSLLFVLVSCVVLASVPALARDWFVKAGSSGDGSQASPFGDPWEALDKCES